MPFYRSIGSRRARKKISTEFELQLTSMMDVLVIILVFLLKSYAASTNSFSTVPGMKLPISASEDVPVDSLQLIITPEAMTFENERILDFQQSAAVAGSDEASYSFHKDDLDEGGRRVISLYNALSKAREKSELLRQKSKVRDKDGNPLPFDGVLAIQADKRIHFDTLRKVMYTAGAAGYKIFRLLAMKRES
jgi:biopolymer transport protein ExbD